jgi:hypothetical protein
MDAGQLGGGFPEFFGDALAERASGSPGLQALRQQLELWSIAAESR